MSEDGPTSSTQNPKLVLGTAVITALTTLGVSFVGIVPQLRNDDRQELTDLKNEVAELKGRAGAVGTGGTEEPRVDTRKTIIIS